MTKNFLDTIYLYNCAIRGKEPEIKSDINIKDVYIISKKQGIWDTVFLSLKRQYTEIYDIDGDNKTGRTVQTRRLGCSW